MNNLLIKNTVYYTLGEMLPKVLSIFLIPFYAQIFTPKDFGIISYTNSIVIFLPILCTLCLNSYVLRFYYECKSVYEQKILIGNLFLFITIISTIVLILGLILIPIILERYRIQVPWNPYFFLAFISFYFEMFSIIPNVYLRVTQNAKYFFYINFLKVVVQYILILILIFYFKIGLYGFYLGNSLALLLFIIVYVKVIYNKVILVLNPKQILKALKFSLPLCPSAFAYLVISFSDRLILEKYVTLHDLGIYSIAFTIAFSVNMFVNGFYKSIEPELFKRINQKDFTLFLSQISNIFYFFVFVISGLVSFFSEEALIILTNNAFLSSINYIYILIIGVVLLSINLFLGGLLTIKKATKTLGISNLIGVITILFSNFFFIPIYGIYAACFSLVVSYLIMNLVMIYYTREFEINRYSPFIALFILIISNTIIFFLFNNNFSFVNLIYKLFLFAFYFFIIKIIFNIRIFDLFAFLKIKNL